MTQTPTRKHYLHCEKVKIYEEKGLELMRIKTALEERRESQRKELAEISQKLAQCWKTRERLKKEVEEQKGKKEEAMIDFQLKVERAEMVRFGEISSPSFLQLTSQSLQTLLLERQEHNNVLKRSLIAAQKQTALRDHILLTQAKELDRKQQALLRKRDYVCRLNETKERLRTEFAEITSSCRSLESDISLQSSVLSTLQNGSCLSQAQLSSLETSTSHLSDQSRTKQASIAALQHEIATKSQHITQLQSEIVKNRETAEVQQARIARLALAEDEMQERVRLKLEEESKWKALHTGEMKTIVEMMGRVKEKEERALAGEKSPSAKGK